MNNCNGSPKNIKVYRVAVDTIIQIERLDDKEDHDKDFTPTLSRDHLTDKIKFL